MFPPIRRRSFLPGVLSQTWLCKGYTVSHLDLELLESLLPFILTTCL